jgi:hypothetical protein
MRREFVTDLASERSLLSKPEMMGVRSRAKQGYEAQNPDAVCRQAVKAGTSARAGFDSRDARASLEQEDGRDFTS